MAEQAQPPEDREIAPHHNIVSDEIVEARVRRSPRYGRILILGVVVGVVVAGILTLTFDGTAQPSVGGVVYSQGQVFGFLSLVCGAVGVLLAGGVALLLDRIVGRRTRPVRVDHETVTNLD